MSERPAREGLTPIRAKIGGDVQRGRRMKAVKTLCEKVAPVQRKKIKKIIIFGLSSPVSVSSAPLCSGVESNSEGLITLRMRSAVLH